MSGLPRRRPRAPVKSLLARLLVVVSICGPAPLQAADANTAPAIWGTPATTGVVGYWYGFTPGSADADGDGLKFSIRNKPAWASFDPWTGRLGGIPGAAGTYSDIRIRVSDGDVTRSLPAFSITVAWNKPPKIWGTPPGSVTVGSFYWFKPGATDPEGRKLSFSIANKPAWAKFDAATGALYGTPLKSGWAGDIRIRVSDGKATASLPAFSIAAKATTAGTVTLEWNAPTQNTDGTPISGLAGYRVAYGTESRRYSTVLPISGASTTSVRIEGLTPGTTYYFAVRAVTSTGLVSDLSSEVSKTL